MRRGEVLLLWSGAGGSVITREYGVAYFYGRVSREMTSRSRLSSPELWLLFNVAGCSSGDWFVTCALRWVWSTFGLFGEARTPKSVLRYCRDWRGGTALKCIR